MNYASDIDLFAGWAEAVARGQFSQTVERRYNAAIIFKRAQGQGRIQASKDSNACSRSTASTSSS